MNGSVNVYSTTIKRLLYISLVFVTCTSDQHIRGQKMSVQFPGVGRPQVPLHA
jgi:hypothetical protein